MRWTAEEDARLSELLGSGLTVEEVGRRIGRSAHAIWEHRNRMRSAPPSSGRRRHYQAQTKERAVRMYREGRTLRGVSEATGVSVKTIDKWVRAASVTRSLSEAARRSRKVRANARRLKAINTHKFTAEEAAKAKSLRLDGLGYGAVARALGRGQGEVYGLLSRTMDNTERLRAFVLERARNTRKTSFAIAREASERFGRRVVPRTVRAYIGEFPELSGKSRVGKVRPDGQHDHPSATPAGPAPRNPNSGGRRWLCPECETVIHGAHDCPAKPQVPDGPVVSGDGP